MITVLGSLRQEKQNSLVHMLFYHLLKNKENLYRNELEVLILHKELNLGKYFLLQDTVSSMFFGVDQFFVFNNYQQRPWLQINTKYKGAEVWLGSFQKLLEIVLNFLSYF